MTKARDLASFLGNNTSLHTINNAYAAGTLIPSSINPSLIINGAMQVAQRGTTSTSDGYHTVDRFRTSILGEDEVVTQEQHTLTSSGDTEVWNLGFRKSYKFTNGNQTSVGADDRILMQYRIEGQDIANSSWNYASSSSDVTLSFWCKSSVAQNFYARLQSYGSADQVYVIETGSLTANTWTKITKTIPGASAVAFENTNSIGALLEFAMFRGTNKTGTRALNVWEAYDTNVRLPDMDSTWYTTNDATFELTGVKLEVGSEATDFQHNSYGEELQKCQRYYEERPVEMEYTNDTNATNIYRTFTIPVEKRATPSIAVVNQLRYWLGGAPSNLNLGSTVSLVATTQKWELAAQSLTGARGLFSGGVVSLDAEL